MKKRVLLSFMFLVFFELSIYSHKGVTIEYILHKPQNLPDNAPLVLALHGHGSSSEKIMAYSGMNTLADIKGFAVCYPQGSLDETGVSFWNSELDYAPVDDGRFLTELAKYLQEHYKLSAKNTFVCGIPNGGFMSYTLARTLIRLTLQAQMRVTLSGCFSVNL